MKILLLATPPIDAKTFDAGISITEMRGIKLKILSETFFDSRLSLVGDFFSGQISQESAKLLRIPPSSRLIGKITANESSGNFSRDARVKIHIDHILLPDGSSIKASCDLHSETPDSTKSKASQIINKSTKVLASTAVGAADAIQYTGIGTLIATSGLTAAVGGALGLGLGLVGHGEEIQSSGFTPLNFKLDSEFTLLEPLPILYEPLTMMDAALLGIDMKIQKTTKSFSKNFGDFIVFDLLISNNSDENVFLGDFVLSSAQHIVPVLASPLLSSNAIDILKPKKQTHCKIAFALGNIQQKNNYEILLLDPLSQEIIAYIKST